jgi:fructose-1,6-bisphosphatase/inositol monophosphatase family enzyme
MWGAPQTAKSRALIRARIAPLSREDGRLGEEHGRTPCHSGALSVVDPIDGSWSFVDGIG